MKLGNQVGFQDRVPENSGVGIKFSVQNNSMAFHTHETLLFKSEKKDTNIRIHDL